MALHGRKEDTIKGKTIAITGCTGGLGRETCRYLADAGANLIMLDRNQQKAEKLEQELRDRAKNITIKRIPIQLVDMESVKSASERLVALKPDCFVAIAGVYRIPRFVCDSGYDNIFQINFLSPYYMASTLHKEIPDIKIVAVGSLAYAFSKIDETDIYESKKSCQMHCGRCFK